MKQNASRCDWRCVFPWLCRARTEDGAPWSELTETDDISTIGASFHLNQKVGMETPYTFVFINLTDRSKPWLLWCVIRYQILMNARSKAL